VILLELMRLLPDGLRRRDGCSRVGERGGKAATRAAISALANIGSISLVRLQNEDDMCLSAGLGRSAV
jgi:hypothetical protein